MDISRFQPELQLATAPVTDADFPELATRLEQGPALALVSQKHFTA